MRRVAARGVEGFLEKRDSVAETPSRDGRMNAIGGGSEHVRQMECPQPSVVGSRSGFRHTWHGMSMASWARVVAREGSDGLKSTGDVERGVARTEGGKEKFDAGP